MDSIFLELKIIPSHLNCTGKCKAGVWSGEINLQLLWNVHELSSTREARNKSKNVQIGALSKRWTSETELLKYCCFAAQNRWIRTNWRHHLTAQSTQKMPLWRVSPQGKRDAGTVHLRVAFLGSSMFKSCEVCCVLQDPSQTSHRSRHCPLPVLSLCTFLPVATAKWVKL